MFSRLHVLFRMRFFISLCNDTFKRMKSYSIIKAGESELNQVHDMAEVVFRHTYRDILSPGQMEYMMDWMYSLTNLRRQLDEGHVYHIAYDDGLPCGYVSVQADGIGDDGVPVYHLQKIYVLPSEQGNGLGRLLFDAALDFVCLQTDRFPARIELNVNRNNPAVDFYKHLGMRVMRQGDFHIGNGFYMNDYIMGLDIKDPFDRLRAGLRLQYESSRNE